MPKREKRLQFTNLQNPWQRFRSRTGFSQTDLAALLKVRQSTVSQYESGFSPEPIYAKRFLLLCRQHKIPCAMEDLYANLEVN